MFSKSILILSEISERFKERVDNFLNNLDDFNVVKIGSNQFQFQFSANHLKGELSIFDVYGRLLTRQKIENVNEKVYLPRNSESLKIVCVKKDGVFLTKKIY